MPGPVLHRVVAVLSLAGVAVMAGAPALAKDAPAATGCVGDADLARLSNGQSLRFIRSVAGDDAQLSVRRWTRTGQQYQERQYAMCTPRDQDHSVLVTRFEFYDGRWQAIAVDTRMGPED
jgi:hypothetical protein